jgi:exo-beta-1,3-glucanase (GH17 family)
MESLISALQGDLIIFEAFDDLWKAPGNDDVENYFVRLMVSKSNSPRVSTQARRHEQ